MSDHKDIFLTLYATNEGGLTKISNQNMFICRICQMTPNTGLKTESQWIQHLLSYSHQSIHQSHQLLRKVLWDLNRTVAITHVMDIRKGEILNYLVQFGCKIIDFSYLASMDGKTDACYALLSSVSEVDKLANNESHFIIQKKCTIRRIADKEKSKYLKWKGKLIEGK